MLGFVSANYSASLECRYRPRPKSPQCRRSSHVEDKAAIVGGMRRVVGAHTTPLNQGDNVTNGYGSVEDNSRAASPRAP